MLLGLFAASRGVAVCGGAIYGFALAFAFMLTGYDGSAPVLSRLPSFAILGVVGALCAVLLAMVGWFVLTGRRRQG